MKPQVLALDLEGSLISNAISQIPRAGLYEFLSHCRELFSRIVIFTAVDERIFRSVATTLVAEQFAPAWFMDIEYIHWHGNTKDLRFIPAIEPCEALLVDDMACYVHPGQESQWLQVEPFDYTSETVDNGLAEILCKLCERLDPSI